MAKMKEFGMEVAKMVYGEYLKNPQIIQRVKTSHPDMTVSFITDQIRTVRANPDEWRSPGRRATT